MDCENCGNADMSFSAEWLGHHVCYECNQRGFGLASDYRARAEKAERERDEARALAVWVECYNAAGRAMGLVAVAPPPNPFEIRRHLDESDRWIGFGDGSPRFFDTEAEALAAGRAVPWWEVEA